MNTDSWNALCYTILRLFKKTSFYNGLLDNILYNLASNILQVVYKKIALILPIICSFSFTWMLWNSDLDIIWVRTKCLQGVHVSSHVLHTWMFSFWHEEILSKDISKELVSKNASPSWIKVSGKCDSQSGCVNTTSRILTSTLKYVYTWIADLIWDPVLLVFSVKHMENVLLWSLTCICLGRSFLLTLSPQYAEQSCCIGDVQLLLDSPKLHVNL